MKTKKCKCGAYKYPDDFFRDGVYQETCNTCYKRSLGTYNYKLRGYKKTTCSRCGALKSNINWSYCNLCNAEYAKNRSKNVTKNNKQIKIFKQRIKAFVDRVEDEKRMVTLQDINEIITLYFEVTTKPSEFDTVESAGMQIQMMYNVLLSISGKKTHF